MNVQWGTIIPISIGAIIAVFGTLYVEKVKNDWKKKDRDKRFKRILEALQEEIQEGIERTNFISKNISFSRIYIALWETVRLEVCQTLDNIDILRYLHQIYYRFDLINFNMERGRFQEGSAFAGQYIEEIRENFKFLKKN